ncbi:hypothetical protein CBS11350_1863 [Aspergillus niger]|nr:hypothetical protein CBS11350_1863 [Aspergillus niger]
MKDQIRTVAVIGCGVIGASWACLFLSRGLNVLIYDPAESARETFENYLQDAWPAFAARSPIEDAWAKNYKFIDNMELSLSEADFIQENGPERPELKQALMEKLDQYTRPGVIISSSSSGLPASRFIGRCQKDPSRILVGHPFNPPHLVPLVEVVPHPGTSATTISTAQDFYRSLGKTPILLHHEVPGFVANRLQAAINSEAYSLISRGIVSAKDLDTVMTSGPGLRWALTGPFVTNSLGGGGGPNGFTQRIERLGPAVRAWEEDMLKHRFDWSEESVSVLKREALQWLETAKTLGSDKMASEGKLLKSNYLQLHYLTLKMSRQIKNVVIAGGTGNLGSHILTALVSHGSFNITVLTRKTGATFPAGVTAKVVDFSSPAELGLAIQGQDAVVDAILSPDPTVSIGLIDAAIGAGVYRYIAPEFTIHPKYDKTRSLPIFRGKAQIYDYLQKVANDQKITWTTISNGAFLDWCLRSGFLNIDLIKKKILLMNDGTRVFPLTVLPVVGTAVANALAQAEKTKNMHCSIYGVQKCQNEIADLAKEALGPDGWEVKSQDMEKAFEEALSATAIGNYSWTVAGDLIRYSLATPGYNGVFEQNHNDLLGVQPMSDEQVKALIKEIYDELNLLHTR